MEGKWEASVEARGGERETMGNEGEATREGEGRVRRGESERR